MLVKILIILTVIVSGFVLLYPDEIIQFSKGSLTQENLENDTNNIKEIFGDFRNEIKIHFNNFFNFLY